MQVKALTKNGAAGRTSLRGNPARYSLVSTERAVAGKAVPVRDRI
jgi:hypothetical protein